MDEQVGSTVSTIDSKEKSTEIEFFSFFYGSINRQSTPFVCGIFAVKKCKKTSFERKNRINKTTGTIGYDRGLRFIYTIH